MEEKLRTLKDLIRYSGAYTGRFVCDELKAEAIKRYKFFALHRKVAKDMTDTELIAYYEGKCDEIYDFFNLTEEDLK